MPEYLELELPTQLAMDGRVLNNTVRQAAKTFVRETFEIAEARLGALASRSLTPTDGTTCTVVAKRVADPGSVENLLRVADLRRLTRGKIEGVWLNPPSTYPATILIATAQAQCGEVLDSFDGAFAFREERRDGDRVVALGLRPPQTGALYAILAHWKVTNAPATVVMPTGTGKTETMLAVFAWERLPRLLVVVPGDALRKQVAAVETVQEGELRRGGPVA